MRDAAIRWYVPPRCVMSEDLTALQRRGCTCAAACHYHPRNELVTTVTLRRLAIAIATAAVAPVSAATISVDRCGRQPGDVVQMIYTAEPGDPAFDTFDFTANAGTTTTWTADDQPRLIPGGAGTGFNGLLDSPTFLGGLGLSSVGLEETSRRLFGAYTRLGGLIDEPSVLIGQFEIASTTGVDFSDIVMNMYRAGTRVNTASVVRGLDHTCVPTPSGTALAGLILLAALSRPASLGRCT